MNADGGNMALRGSLIELMKTIGVRIDAELRERTGLAGLLSPSQIHRIRAARFRIESYEELNFGDTVIPRVGWSAREEYVYGEDGIQDFVSAIQNLGEFDSVLTQLREAELRERDTGMLQLYLTILVYFVTITMLEDRAASQERMVEAFMKDVEEDRIQAVVELGLAGVVVKDGPIEISKDVQLRRLDRLDYHEESEPLTDKSIHQVSFPSQHGASSVLELSTKPGLKLDQLYGSVALLDVRMWSRIREFDLLIQQLIPLAQVWNGTLQLVQSETDPMIRFVRVELNLPRLSPGKPIYTWKQQNRTHEPRGSFSISKDDTRIVSLPRALVAKNYSRLVHPNDGAETPLSLAYSRYVEILRSREASEKTIRDEVEALEAFFTPGLDVNKAFIQRVAHLVRIVSVDENATANLLRNGYHIRSSYTHRGTGWDESVHAAATTEEAGFAWESYKSDLAHILLVYLRLSIVSRILSQYDERTFIEVLDNSEKTGVADTNIVSLSEQLSCKISHVNDFVKDKEATEKYEIPLHVIRNRIESRQIAAITLRRPGRNGRQGITHLIPEWALLSLKDEMDHLSPREGKST
jgi:hypothetical protein